MFDLVVVGEGYAGLICAAESARRGLKVATIEAAFLGGLVVNVNELDGFDEADGVSGMDQATIMAAGNRRAGVSSIAATARSVVPVDGGFEVETDAGRHRARQVVIATGARLRTLGVPGEAEFAGRGVSHCADCDAPLFADADVVVAGAGDWAFKDALLLAREGATVHVVYPEAEPGASAAFVDRVRAEPRVQLHPGLEIRSVVGDAQGMTAVQLVDSQGQALEIQARGLFVMTGLVANSEIAPGAVARDAEGCLMVDERLQTVLPGLWAIGQVRSRFGGWLRDAAADARRVAAQL